MSISARRPREQGPGRVEPRNRGPEDQRMVLAQLDAFQNSVACALSSGAEMKYYRLPSTCFQRCTFGIDRPVIGRRRFFHPARAVFDSALVVQLRAESDPPVESGPNPQADAGSYAKTSLSRF